MATGCCDTYNARMSAPLAEHALDFLDADERRLVKEMLRAVVEHPDIYDNGFSVSETRSGDYEYHLANGNRVGPFTNRQRLKTDCSGKLVHYGFAGAKLNPQWPANFHSFSEQALEWHRRYGGPDPDEIRKRIGRYLREQETAQGYIPPVHAQAVAAALGLPEAQASQQIRLLVGKNLLQVDHRGSGMGFGVLSFTADGMLWAERGFPPIDAAPSPVFNFALNLRVEVNAVIERAQERHSTPEQIEELKALLEAVRIELEKPAGQGRYQPVKDLIGTTADSATIFGVVLPFLNEHWDKIEQLAGAVDKLIP